VNHGRLFADRKKKLARWASNLIPLAHSARSKPARHLLSSPLFHSLDIVCPIISFYSDRRNTFRDPDARSSVVNRASGLRSGLGEDVGMVCFVPGLDRDLSFRSGQLAGFLVSGSGGALQITKSDSPRLHPGIAAWMLLGAASARSIGGAENPVTCSSQHLPRVLHLRYLGYRCSSFMSLFPMNVIPVHLSAQDFDRG
jgi:hypothetical protein